MKVEPVDEAILTQHLSGLAPFISKHLHTHVHSPNVKVVVLDALMNNQVIHDLYHDLREGEWRRSVYM